ncbi:MAG: hypothetical protein EHM78_27325 [Myxococcaceae bacterium]|nr:MAG: hypothetical protein EHM78_27325 [Myxococcaceae bacterium]
MARKKDQEYFCNGLAEALTNALTRLRGLCVIAAPRRRVQGKGCRELERRSGERYVGQLAHFMLHNGSREIDAALEWLARSMDARDGMVPFIGVDTALDGLRSDPRFGAMLKRLGLPA